MIGWIRIVRQGNKITVYSSKSEGFNKVWNYLGDITTVGDCDMQFPVAFADEFDCDCGGNPFCETCMGHHKIVEPPDWVPSEKATITAIQETAIEAMAEKIGYKLPEDLSSYSYKNAMTLLGNLNFLATNKKKEEEDIT